MVPGGVTSVMCCRVGQASGAPGPTLPVIYTLQFITKYVRDGNYREERRKRNQSQMHLRDCRQQKLLKDEVIAV